MKKKINKKTKKKDVSKPKINSKFSRFTNTPKKRLIFYGILSIIIVFLLYFLLNFATLINFLLGNDTLVKLVPSSPGFSLENSESVPLSFSIYISTNMFCEVECEYQFKDISSNELIDSGMFSKKIANPQSKDYLLKAPSSGEGQILYSFDLVCKTYKTKLCKSEEEKKQNVLIPLNYKLNRNQANLKNKLESDLIETIRNYESLKETEQKLKVLESDLAEYLYIQNRSFLQEDYYFPLETIVNDWKYYKYDEDNLDYLNEMIITDLNELKDKLEKRMVFAQEYNTFVQELISMRELLINFAESENFSQEDSINLNSTIFEFNLFLNNVFLPFDLEKTKIQYNQLNISTNLNFDGKEIYNESFPNEIQFKEIDISKRFKHFSNLSLEFSEEICCYLNDCKPCCDKSCSNKEELYPILLIHGHSFNQKISAEKSLTDLNKIQEYLEKEGFVNAGQLTIGSGGEEIFIKTNKRLVFEVSYYFDIYQNSDSKTILQTKSDNINTYAIRLNDLIDEIKLSTGKDKVVLVAHSMGGLVSRRYLQIYGDNAVSQLIMIGTPNNGIDGSVLVTCPVFGADSHCKDMDKDSLIINKLTYGIKPKIPVTTIIGQGCKLDGEDSDGVVKVSSAKLNWAENIYVNGTCSGFEFLHNEMLDPEKYPEVYKILKETLQN